jgi:peptide subunit release factor 1 (eRF1)
MTCKLNNSLRAIMKTDTLKHFTRNLMRIEPNKSPVISCFLNLEGNRREQIEQFTNQWGEHSKILSGNWAEEMESARGMTSEYLSYDLKAQSQSVVMYVRAGDKPVFEATQFEVPLKTQILVDELPHIYPLIELKDTYHRFVIIITTESKAQILETTIGSVTEEIMATRPELRQRIGREWTQEHYRNNKFEKEQQFIKEKIRIVDELMTKNGHNHLIVAGSPKMVNRLTSALPERLKSKLVTKFSYNPQGGLGPLLRNCILEFSAAEKLESHDYVQVLQSAVLSHGLGITGFEACREALLYGYADLLIIAQDFNNQEGREELVRMATETRIQIETVSESNILKQLGGVGCLLRYRPNFSTVSVELENNPA